MEIRKLAEEAYKGKKFEVCYRSRGYYDLQRRDMGFSMTYRPFEKETELSFEDCFFGDWLEAPVGYGAFENGQMLGFVEGSIESWNHRYRISNICVFAEERRHQHIGTALMDTAIQEAKKSGARMAVLETQTCNERAIGFYQKYGFEIIGFDLYAYSNADPERHEVRIEMGMKL